MTTAVYAGSFDPMTRGHASVVVMAAKLFHHVRVLVADNPAKQPLFAAAERVRLARATLREVPNVSVAHTRGLVVEHARRIGATHLLRGVRDLADVGSELELAAANQALAPELATVFLPAQAELAVVSSSELKRRLVAGLGVTAFCVVEVERALRRRISQQGAA